MIIWFILKSKPAISEKTSKLPSPVTNLLLPVSALLSKIVLLSYV